jgi:Uncharacterized conserved protein
MKKAKTPKRSAPPPSVTDARRRLPYQKAAIRSHAFAKAILDANIYLSDPERLRALFDEASRKAATIPRESFKDSWSYLQSMLRLIRAYVRGEYRNAPRDSLLTVIAAVAYLVDPFDLIPDEIPFLGFLDDATVIGFAATRARAALDEFMIWETTAL